MVCAAPLNSAAERRPADVAVFCTLRTFSSLAASEQQMSHMLRAVPLLLPSRYLIWHSFWVNESQVSVLFRWDLFFFGGGGIDAANNNTKSTLC